MASRIVPRHRSDLVLRRLSDDEFVVKLASRRKYFTIGAVEAFLLERLDGQRTRRELRKEYEAAYGEKLERKDLSDFLEMVRKLNLLEGEEVAAEADPDSEDDEEIAGGTQAGGSLLFYRVPLFDPERVLNWLEPKLRWVWTRAFLVVSLLAIVFAGFVVWGNRGDLVSAFPSIGWETILLVWLVVILTTALHEFAHGLTCKHFGGEVREMGVLVMFFMPCMYCNVSDAWLLPEKRKRMLITLAGGYCDLVIWAVAVFVWRVTMLDTLVNHVAFIVLTVCGGRGFINLNPLLRLDGYYLLSDGLGIPNLRKEAREYWTGHLRHWLWGAEKPAPHARGRVLLAYGLFVWVFAVFFLNLIFTQFVGLAGDQFGTAGVVFVCLLLAYGLKRVLRGLFRSEFATMIKNRPGRTRAWLAGLAAVVVLAFVVPIKHYATGTFEVRPGRQTEVPAPVTGFIRTVHVHAGSAVRAGDVLVELSSPELESSLVQKEALLRESDARLAKLTRGPRREEIAEQRARVQRLRAFRDTGTFDLEQAELAHEQQLAVLDAQIERADAELRLHRTLVAQSQQLYAAGALAGAELNSDRTMLTVLESQLVRARAERRVLEVTGTRTARADLDRREQSLADAEAALALMEAGSRQEDIDAERAQRERIATELDHLRSQRDKLVVRAAVDGIVATPRLQEKVGLLAVQGTQLCVLQDPSTARVEITITEDLVLGISEGQTIRLKARAMPYENFYGSVNRVAPMLAPSGPSATDAAQPKSTADRQSVVVHCDLAEQSGRLRPGMTGVGRIDRGWNTLGLAVLSKGMRYLRTEFWW